MNAHGFSSFQVKPDYEGAPEPWAVKTNRRPTYGELTPEVYHQYSLHANWGTFLIHRWLRAGMPVNRLEEAKQSSVQLGQAIDINPDAHAGREVVQLAIVDWLIESKTGKATGPPSFESGYRALEGLSGLVELGAAWNSYDVFAMITNVSQRGAQAMAYFRAKELLAAGTKPLTNVEISVPPDDMQERYRGEFNELRRTAKLALDNRWEFMRQQFAQGRHPDTDWNFWKGYVPPIRPTIYRPWPDRLLAYSVLVVLDLFGCVWIPLVAFVIIRIVKGRRTRKAAT